MLSHRASIQKKEKKNQLAELVDLAFAASLGEPWKPLIQTLSYENKGLGESFMLYLKKRADLNGKPFTSQSAVRVRTRQLGSLYR